MHHPQNFPRHEFISHLSGRSPLPYWHTSLPVIGWDIALSSDLSRTIKICSKQSEVCSDFTQSIPRLHCSNLEAYTQTLQYVILKFLQFLPVDPLADQNENSSLSHTPQTLSKHPWNQLMHSEHKHGKTGFWELRFWNHLSCTGQVYLVVSAFFLILLQLFLIWG